MSETTLTEEDLPTRDAQYYIKNKNITAMWLMMAMQIVFCVLSMDLDLELETTNQPEHLQQFFHTSLILILIIIGFGLLFAYTRKLAWSAVGYNLLITAICVQLYFFFNVFWMKTGLQKKSDRNFRESSSNYIYIWDQHSTYGTLIEGLKCSLSIIVAFSFIIGRAGILEAYFMSVLGTPLYELSRIVALKVVDEEIGTAKIFLFGGMLGAMCSVFIYRTEVSTLSNPHYMPSTRSISICLLGLLFVWVLFPLLSLDASTQNSTLTTNIKVSNIALSLAASSAFGGAISFTLLGFQGFMMCSLAGGIACLSSAAYIANPVYAIVVGMLAAAVQAFLMQLKQPLKGKFGHIDGGNAFLFCAQGILGLGLLAMNRAIVYDRPQNLEYSWDYRSQAILAFAAGWIPAGIGLILGIILGLIFSCFTVHDREDHYTDFAYWKKGSHLSNKIVETEQDPHTIHYKERTSTLKEKHAYL